MLPQLNLEVALRPLPHHFIRFCLIIVCLVAFSSTVHSESLENQHLAECKSIEAGFKTTNLLPYLFHFVDDDEKVAPSYLNRPYELNAVFEGMNFQQIQQQDREYVLGGNGTDHWLRFCLSNRSNSNQNLVLQTHPANFAEIDFYPQTKERLAFRTGYKRAYRSRDIQGSKYHFNIALAPRESQTFFIRLNTRAQAFIQVRLDEHTKYEYDKGISESLDGLYAGVLVCTILYALFLCIWGRQRYSLFYFLWCTSSAVLFAGIDGRLIQFFRPDNTQPLLLLSFVLYPITSVLSAFFAREFIGLQLYSKLDKIGLAIILVFFSVFLVLMLANESGPAIKVSALFALVVSIYFGVVTPIYAIVKNNSLLAKYLLFAHLPMFVCIVDRVILALGLTPHYYIPYTPKVGLGIFMILMAVSSGISAYREKEKAQQLAISSLEKTNELKNNYNKSLEHEVLEKTTEIQLVNKELEERSTKLEELDKVKSTFFTNISHEFRTPITLIQGPLNQLLEKQDFPSKGVLKSVVNQAENLKKLVDQLLLLSKFDDQSLNLATQKVNVGETVKQLYSQFESLAQTRDITLTFDNDGHGVKAYLDLEKLSVIVNNLVSNAIKFTAPNGRVHVVISSSSENAANQENFTTDEYVHISVLDTGAGVLTEDVNRIFDRFYQSSSSPLTSAGVGTGIGLALVKELTHLHGGTVELIRHPKSSNSGAAEQGMVTEFLLKFPLGNVHLKPSEILAAFEPLPQQAAERYEQESDCQSLRSSNNRSNLNLPRLLIVDDNADMRLYLHSLLDADYQLLEAHDGLEAQKQVSKSMPNLIITDLMMPEHDGLSLVSWLKQDKQFKRIPIIMLTAKAGQENLLAGLAAEVDDYLSKPFDANELKLRIQNLLKRQSQFGLLQAPHNTVEPPAGDNDDEFVVKARLAIQSNIDNSKFSVPDLAELLHVSKATLNRRLSKKIQLSASEYIRHCRLEMARDLLANRKVETLKELAAVLGFSQPSYFARLYEATYGHAPFSSKVD